MSRQQNGNEDRREADSVEDLQRGLLTDVHLQDAAREESESGKQEDDNDVSLNSDVQGALGQFAEATQDMATATLELNLGRHFACADYCNQAVEKAAQSVSLLRFGRRSMYDHDLRALGAIVGAPAAIQDEIDVLTPFHPEAFYADTPPEEADEVISAEQAQRYIKSARAVLRWAKSLVLNA
jgi:HEPN domain-containing protein